MDTTSIILRSTLFEAKLTRPRPGSGQMLDTVVHRGRGQLVEAKAEAKILASMPVCPRGLTSLICAVKTVNTGVKYWVLSTLEAFA